MSTSHQQSGASIREVLDRIDRHIDRNIETLFEFLSIPSVSADEACDRQCRQAAGWVASELRQMGFESTVRETDGKPIVVAHWPGALANPSGPSVLFYGHYDVQPPDPLESWHGPPFEPRLQEGEAGQPHITARGVADNKGQLMTFLEACRAWIHEAGSLPVPVSVVIEGEEEIGSPSFASFLSANKADLDRDVVMVCDTLMWNRDTPAITTRLRGMLSEELEIEAASCDLHSGLYGNAARNSISVLMRILADLVDAGGRIRIPGFYDDVEDVPQSVLSQWRALDFDEADFLGNVGLQLPAGEIGYGALEQIWARPSCDVSGITGGYTGSGFKTVIPSRASAKVSFRLVPEQSPERVRERFRAFVRERLPGDCTVRFVDHGASNPIALDEGNPFLVTARKALDQEFERGSVLIGCGASIPIVEMFKSELDLDCLLTGFALEEDRVHSPNEKYEVSSFHRGTRFWARLLSELASLAPAPEPGENGSGVADGTLAGRAT